jgi:hypothetical protein
VNNLKKAIVNNQKKTTEIQAWKRNVLIIGVVTGAAVGFWAAYLFSQNVDDLRDRPSFSAGDGVRLGLLVLGLLRSVTEMGSQK